MWCFKTPSLCVPLLVRGWKFHTASIQRHTHTASEARHFRDIPDYIWLPLAKKRSIFLNKTFITVKHRIYDSILCQIISVSCTFSIAVAILYVSLSNFLRHTRIRYDPIILGPLSVWKLVGLTVYKGLLFQGLSLLQYLIKLTEACTYRR
jgi:hypothetical protein